MSRRGARIHRNKAGPQLNVGKAATRRYMFAEFSQGSAPKTIDETGQEKSMSQSPDDKTLLIVEDDRPLRERLARAMEARGFTVTIAESVAEGKTRAKEAPPAFAVVDLKLDDGNGL